MRAVAGSNWICWLLATGTRGRLRVVRPGRSELSGGAMKRAMAEPKTTREPVNSTNAQRREAIGSRRETSAGCTMRAAVSSATKARLPLSFRLSATRGHADGMVRYGYALDHGQGVSANAQEACDWYEKAAGLGDAMGMNNLGACFANGTGRPTNLQMAVECYERAAALRNGLALKNLGDLYAVGKGIPRDEAKATDYYRRSAEAGTPSGMIKYGFNARSRFRRCDEPRVGM